MNILIGLLPAIIWGLLPLAITRFVKGGPLVQITGIGIGTTIVAIITTIIVRPELPGTLGLILCFLSGLTWMIGTYGQMYSFKKIGVSRVFPLSSGVQIVGNALLGWLVLHEWVGAKQVLLGVLFVVLIIAGIILCNKEGKKANDLGADSADGDSAEEMPKLTKAEELKILLMIALTSLGYCAYSLFPKLSGAGAMSQTLPQGLGMLVGAVVISFVFGKENPFKMDKKNIRIASCVGLFYGIASLIFLVSIARNGMVNGFILSQLNMVIATLSGIFIIKEAQKVPLWRTALGVIAIFAGCILIQLI